jgi:ferrochelatase
MEVVYDLDTEAAALCRELGVNLSRASTVGVHPAFVSMIRELIRERVDGRAGAGDCRPDCCAPPARPPVRPAVAL